MTRAWGGLIPEAEGADEAREGADEAREGARDVLRSVAEVAGGASDVLRSVAEVAGVASGAGGAEGTGPMRIATRSHASS